MNNDQRYYLYFYGPYFSRLTQPDILDDEEVDTLVRDILFWDSWVDSGKVDIIVKEGIVTLKGTVQNQLEKRAAGDDAWDTPGVRDVMNEIEIEGI
ncbi:TPA: transporter [candidate division CPR2 bacterium]|uniref:BON domain-containing protein n=1 Tax=candidate division CPR2 bacterium GW2011_GWC1_41_48 TaxID=1618344 RepID=A0A0G0W8K5_UNCC2|nr:MAG: hypothetical protein UT47_C0002G0216 [candidate division CPR2 bacterium GW2011_GWC2_39_35]KKR29074.1 MAG: hypothetical protein UT60_C0007G0019 [candidate division CPR2 bacterium GW2011_GWD2_39_7]KKS09310.1 MAG: hypothetical protein UU65_C0002G0088 [candidate division CPR2 bacterium GW2011_GWC1_41_48]OGB70562.1 MAG: hypothetical protein A2Y26_04445 [candidate division CPR2 bacterium GWD2_39_7]HBG82066.1 transporter [candidate division CPR2 bacterium]